jgi:hypothetical protein
MNHLRQRIYWLARDLEGQTVPLSDVMALVSALTTTLKRHVTDRETLRAIAADFRRLATARGANQR